MPKQSPMNISHSTPQNDDSARSAADLEAGYRAMAEDAEREAEALEWIEAAIKDGVES